MGGGRGGGVDRKRRNETQHVSLVGSVGGRGLERLDFDEMVRRRGEVKVRSVFEFSGFLVTRAVDDYDSSMVLEPKLGRRAG